MGWIKGSSYAFTPDVIDIAPNEEGVYLIVDRDNNPIYVGRGNIRERLTSHYNRREDVDKCIWEEYNPTHYYCEACSNSEEREKELIIQLKPPCNEKIG